MKIAAKRSYPIKINAEEYSLTPNASNVYQYIKVDLSDYGIVLTESETMAFFASTDTLIPAYISNIQKTNPAWQHPYSLFLTFLKL